MAITNISAETAWELSYPDHPTTQRVDEGGTTYDVWYKWTNPNPFDVVMSYWHYGDVGNGFDGYTPYSIVWGNDPGPGPELIFLTSLYEHGSATVTVLKNATIFIEIQHLLGDFSPSLLTIGWSFKPQEPPSSGLTPQHIWPPQAGDILIPSARFSRYWLEAGYQGWSAAYISPAGREARPDLDPPLPAIAPGGIAGFVPQFPVGEVGDVFDAPGETYGRILMIDNFGTFGPEPPAGSWYVHIFDPNFVHLSRTLVPSSVMPPIGRLHLPSDLVYLLQWNTGGTGHVMTIDAYGTLRDLHEVGAEYPGALMSLAVSASGGVLYLGHGFPTGTVTAWDLRAHRTIGDLLPAVSGYYISDLLVLADDTIIAAYQDRTTERDPFVRRLTFSGEPGTASILNEYHFTLTKPQYGPDQNRLAYSVDDDCFWFYIHQKGTDNDVRKVRVGEPFGSGDELYTMLVPNFYNMVLAQTDPPVPYASDSCPIMELRGPGTVWPPGPGGPGAGPRGSIGPIAWVMWPRTVP